MILLCFFFFKQKTAYEIRLSLVGSEMCIRDRSYDPREEIRKVRVPVLIVNGDIDFQVTPDNADALAKAQPRSRKTIIEGMTHTLKKASGPTRTEQIAAYTDDTLPIAPELVAAVTGFIEGL